MDTSEDKTNYGYDQPSDMAVYRGPQASYPDQGIRPNYQPPLPVNTGGYAPVMTQPASHSTVVVNSGPPRPIAAPQNIREWSTGMCSCLDDIASCCFAFWCYPCFMCTLSERMGENCCGPFCCGCVFNAVLRNKVRTMYGIRGSVCNDVCTVGCCEMCAMCQLKRELDAMDAAQNNYNITPNTVVVTQAHSQY